MHFRVFISILSLYPLVIRNNLPLPHHSYDDQKSLQTLANVPREDGGQNCLQLKTLVYLYDLYFPPCLRRLVFV